MLIVVVMEIYRKIPLLLWCNIQSRSRHPSIRMSFSLTSSTAFFWNTTGFLAVLVADFSHTSFLYMYVHLRLGCAEERIKLKMFRVTNSDKNIMHCRLYYQQFFWLSTTLPLLCSLKTFSVVNTLVNRT